MGKIHIKHAVNYLPGTYSPEGDVLVHSHHVKVTWNQDDLFQILTSYFMIKLVSASNLLNLIVNSFLFLQLVRILKRKIRIYDWAIQRCYWQDGI
jgi:hypothetical protein